MGKGERDGEREKAGRKCKSLEININAHFRGTRVYARAINRYFMLSVSMDNNLIPIWILFLIVSNIIRAPA